jgi:hypothetical protein
MKRIFLNPAPRVGVGSKINWRYNEKRRSYRLQHWYAYWKYSKTDFEDSDGHVSPFKSNGTCRSIELRQWKGGSYHDLRNWSNCWKRIKRRCSVWWADGDLKQPASIPHIGWMQAGIAAVSATLRSDSKACTLQESAQISMAAQSFNRSSIEVTSHIWSPPKALIQILFASVLVENVQWRRVILRVAGCGLLCHLWGYLPYTTE